MRLTRTTCRIRSHAHRHRAHGHRRGGAGRTGAVGIPRADRRGGRRAGRRAVRARRLGREVPSDLVAHRAGIRRRPELAASGRARRRRPVKRSLPGDRSRRAARRRRRPGSRTHGHAGGHPAKGGGELAVVRCRRATRRAPGAHSVMVAARPYGGSVRERSRLAIGRSRRPPRGARPSLALAAHRDVCRDPARPSSQVGQDLELADRRRRPGRRPRARARPQLLARGASGNARARSRRGRPPRRQPPRRAPRQGPRAVGGEGRARIACRLGRRALRSACRRRQWIGHALPRLSSQSIRSCGRG